MSEHGTETHYKKGCRCDVCRAGVAAARAKRRAGTGPGSIPKGQQAHSINGYMRHGCRCEVCCAANAAKMRRWRERVRADA